MDAMETGVFCDFFFEFGSNEFPSLGVVFT